MLQPSFSCPPTVNVCHFSKQIKPVPIPFGSIIDFQFLAGMCHQYNQRFQELHEFARLLCEIASEGNVGSSAVRQAEMLLNLPMSATATDAFAVTFLNRLHGLQEKTDIENRKLRCDMKKYLTRIKTDYGYLLEHTGALASAMKVNHHRQISKAFSDRHSNRPHLTEEKFAALREAVKKVIQEKNPLYSPTDARLSRGSLMPIEIIRFDREFDIRIDSFAQILNAFLVWPFALQITAGEESLSSRLSIATQA